MCNFVILQINTVLSDMNFSHVTLSSGKVAVVCVSGIDITLKKKLC